MLSISSLGRRPAASRNWICFSSRVSETFRKSACARTSALALPAPLPFGFACDSSASSRATARPEPVDVRIGAADEAFGIDVDSVGIGLNGSRAADFVPARGSDGRSDQIHERSEIGAAPASRRGPAL